MKNGSDCWKACANVEGREKKPNLIVGERSPTVFICARSFDVISILMGKRIRKSRKRKEASRRDHVISLSHAPSVDPRRHSQAENSGC